MLAVTKKEKLLGIILSRGVVPSTRALAEEIGDVTNVTVWRWLRELEVAGTLRRNDAGEFEVVR